MKGIEITVIIVACCIVALVFAVWPDKKPDRIEGLELRVRELERNQEKMVAISSTLHQRIQMTEGWTLTMLTNIRAVQTNVTRILDAMTPPDPWIGDVQVTANLTWKKFMSSVPLVLTNDIITTNLGWRLFYQTNGHGFTHSTNRHGPAAEDPGNP